jgi:hypothetical protein
VVNTGDADLCPLSPVVVKIMSHAVRREPAQLSGRNGAYVFRDHFCMSLCFRLALVEQAGNNTILPRRAEGLAGGVPSNDGNTILYPL